jgi:hypothetical protein
MDGWVRALLAAAVSGLLAGCASNGNVTVLPATSTLLPSNVTHTVRRLRCHRRSSQRRPADPQAYSVRAMTPSLGSLAYG